MQMMKQNLSYGTFTPKLFISIGEHNHFFTLRETELYFKQCGEVGSFEVRSFHHCNLSQNSDEAFSKALKYAESFGLELETSASTLKEQMDAIKRETADEAAKREARIAAQFLIDEAARIEREAAMKAVADGGVFPFGQFADKPFNVAPVSYLNWMMKSVDEFEPDSMIKYVAERICELCADVRLPEPTGGYVGQVKERLSFEATVVRTSGFETQFGWTAVTTMVDTEGHCLVVFSGAFMPSVGEKLVFKATVKDHKEYEETEQTILQRVTLDKGAEK